MGVDSVFEGKRTQNPPQLPSNSSSRISDRYVFTSKFRFLRRNYKPNIHEGVLKRHHAFTAISSLRLLLRMLFPDRWSRGTKIIIIPPTTPPPSLAASNIG